MSITRAPLRLRPGSRIEALSRSAVLGAHLRSGSPSDLSLKWLIGELPSIPFMRAESEQILKKRELQHGSDAIISQAGFVIETFDIAAIFSLEHRLTAGAAGEPRDEEAHTAKAPPMTDRTGAGGAEILVDQLGIQACDQLLPFPVQSFLAVLDALYDTP